MSLKVISITRQGPALPRIDLKHIETGVFPTELSDIYPFAPYPSPKFAVTLQAAYPAGDDRIAILRSMLPKSRRVRWLSASNGQDDNETLEKLCRR